VQTLLESNQVEQSARQAPRANEFSTINEEITFTNSNTHQASTSDLFSSAKVNRFESLNVAPSDSDQLIMLEHNEESVISKSEQAKPTSPKNEE